MIYTSYYSNPKLKNFKGSKVQISTSKPSWFKIDRSIKELYPGWELVKNHKDGVISNQEYTDTYISHLNSIDWSKISIDQDSVLLCWCGRGKFCHRHILRHYLRDKFSIEIKEL